MELAKIISHELKVDPDKIILLRHGNAVINKLLQYDTTVDELTAIQPLGTRYDFHGDGCHADVVVVVVNDRVYGVYRVHGILREGTNYSLSTDAFQQFERDRNIAEASCRRYDIERVQSITNGLAVSGWERRTRTPIQRHNDSFFWEIEVKLNAQISPIDELHSAFSKQVSESASLTPEQRLNRIQHAPRIPKKIEVINWVFVRNPDVVAHVLYRANGVCEYCQNNAPFNRRVDGTPYLEVHHIIPLSLGGDDAIDNAVALCPNCHRKTHYA